MQVTRDNYEQHLKLMQEMFNANSNDPMAECDYGNYALRFKSVDIAFPRPNWNTIATKRDKAAMSEAEFDEASMKKTGGKMNAACMFWDSKGNKTLSYNPVALTWREISTEEEFGRARLFTSIYNDEYARLAKNATQETTVGNKVDYTV